MVKFLLILIALMSLAIGGVFLIIPESYVALSQAEPTNIAWLRMIGAGLVALQGLGLAITAFRRRDTNPLIALIALSSTAEAGALWYSLFAGEFSAQALWTVVVPGVLATAASVVIWIAWASRRKSLGLLGGGSEPLPADVGQTAPPQDTDVPMG